MFPKISMFQSSWESHANFHITFPLYIVSANLKNYVWEPYTYMKKCYLDYLLKIKEIARIADFKI